MFKRFYFITALLLSTFVSQAKLYYFQNYQVDDGLLHNTVTAIMHDHKGFIWIGPKGGLDRLDGYYFKDFSFAERHSGENLITTLKEDQSGKLWIGMPKGLFFLDLPSDLSCPNINGLFNDNRAFAGPFLQRLEILDKRADKTAKTLSGSQVPIRAGKSIFHVYR